MSVETIAVIKKAMDDGTDCVVVIKGGLIESVAHLDFGDINVKFHASKVTQVDTTDRKKY